MSLQAMSWQTWFFTNFGKFTNHTARPWQAGLAFFLHSASLLLFLRVGRRMFRANSNDVSIMMKLFVAVWIIENLLALPYAFFIAAFWRPVELDYYWETSENVGFTRFRKYLPRLGEQRRNQRSPGEAVDGKKALTNFFGPCRRPYSINYLLVALPFLFLCQMYAAKESKKACFMRHSYVHNTHGTNLIGAGGFRFTDPVILSIIDLFEAFPFFPKAEFMSSNAKC